MQHVPPFRYKCCTGSVWSCRCLCTRSVHACSVQQCSGGLNPKRDQKTTSRLSPCRICWSAPLQPPMTSFRQLRPHDNPLIAQIIRDTLSEFGAAKPGTVYFDPTTDDLHSLFQQPLAHYLVAENDGVVVGGCGIFPTAGLPCGYCELVKLYLTPAARGKGIGKRLILCCLEKARELGFSSVYLESMDELRHAVALYERLGFQHMGAALGRSGHFGCSIWMAMSLA